MSGVKWGTVGCPSFYYIGNYSKSEYDRDTSYVSNIDAYGWGLLDNFDLVISHNSQSVNTEGVYFFDKKFESEDQCLAERIVSFYFSLEDQPKYVNDTDQRDRLKSHFRRAIEQPVIWSREAERVLGESYCTLRKKFSQIHLHGKKTSKVNTNHLRCIMFLFIMFYNAYLFSYPQSRAGDVITSKNIHITTYIFRTIMKISECLAKLFPSHSDEPVSTVDCKKVEQAIKIVILENSHFLCSNADLIDAETIIALRKSTVNKTSSLVKRPKMSIIDPLSP